MPTSIDTETSVFYNIGNFEPFVNELGSNI